MEIYLTTKNRTHNEPMLVPREIRGERIGVIPLETHQRYPVGEIAKAVKSHSTTG
jgi:hypothetical protein